MAACSSVASATLTPKCSQAAKPAPAPTTPPATTPAPASSDRDEVSGYQVHVIYVIPSDGEDQGLEWGIRPVARMRLDAFEGQTDVSFFRMSATDAEVSAKGVYMRDEIERQLKDAGRIRGEKIYAVHYDGNSPEGCGGSRVPAITDRARGGDLP